MSLAIINVLFNEEKCIYISLEIWIFAVYLYRVILSEEINIVWNDHLLTVRNIEPFQFQLLDPTWTTTLKVLQGVVHRQSL